MKIIGVYPGRFHPFHKGHAASFKQLAKKFGLDNTYLAISAKQEQPKSPFSAKDRASMAMSLGIPAKNIIIVNSPYKAEEYIDKLQLDPNNTILVFGVSKKDMEGDPELGIPPDPRFTFNPKRDGTPSYLQPLDKNPKPISKHAYVMSTDVAEFPIAGKSMRDASSIRQAYAGADENTKMRILTDLYGDKARDMKQIFDNNLVITEGVLSLVHKIKESMPNATLAQKKKFVKLLKEAKVTLSEAQSAPGHRLNIVKRYDTQNGKYVLTHELYDDEDVVKDDFDLYKEVSPDQYEFVGNLRVSSYRMNRKPGDIENEVTRLIAMDSNISEAKEEKSKSTKNKWVVTDKDNDGKPEVKLRKDDDLRHGSIINRKLLAHARSLYPTAKNDIEAVFHYFGVKFDEMEKTIEDLQLQIDTLNQQSQPEPEPEPAPPEAKPAKQEAPPPPPPSSPPPPPPVKESRRNRSDYLSEK